MNVSMVPLANGLQTDHPYPGVPFVDDSHIPVDDPQAIEAIGRGRDEDMWGREDALSYEGADAGWVAFTTDEQRRDLAWLVRWHPKHGRSVLLFSDEDISSIYYQFSSNESGLLYRAGGYWWDGATWYRPSQVWDATSELFVRRPVPGASMTTAADLLDAAREPATLPSPMRVGDLAIDPLTTSEPSSWIDHLHMWARNSSRSTETAFPLDRAVIRLTAPELTADQLVSAAEFADLAGVSASTFRAYVSRNEADIPERQAVLSGRNVWARKVAEEWIEMRSHSGDAVAESMASRDFDAAALPIGISEVWDSFTKRFVTRLWAHPERRKRWAMKWRTQEAVESVARDLAWQVAGGLPKLLPMRDLGVTVREAVLEQMAYGKKLEDSLRASRPRLVGDDETRRRRAAGFYGVTPQVAKTLGWLVRHDPEAGGHAINTIIGEARSRHEIDRATAVRTIRTALSLDGGLGDALNPFLDAVLAPSATTS